MTKDSPPDSTPDPAAGTSPEAAAPENTSSAVSESAEAPAPAGKEVPHIHRLRIAFNVALQLLLGLVLYGLVNYLASRHFKQWDNTYEKRFTLSPTTLEFLKKITVPIRITLLTERGKEPEKDLSALLQQYKDAMKGKLEVKVIDTLRDTGAWENFKVQQGLTAQAGFETNGVVVQTDAPSSKPGDPVLQRLIPEAALYDIDPKTKLPQAFKGESLVNQAIHAVTTVDQQKLGIIAGLGLPRRLPNGSSAFDSLNDICVMQNIKLEPYSILEKDEKFDADALIWFAPQDVSDRETALLKEYLEQPGHSLCVMLNPERNTPALDKFLATYGIVPQVDRVLSVDDRGSSGVLKNYLVDNARFLDGSQLTTGIVSQSVTLTGRSRSLRIETGTEKQRAENIEVKPILSPSSGEFWGETDFEAVKPTRDEKVDNILPYVIAAAERGAAKNPRMQMNSSRLIVFGNSEFADPDAMSTTKYDFLIRSINWMMHRDVVAPNDSSTDKAKHKFQIQIKPQQWQRIFWTTTIILPLAALMTGLMIWSTRRY